MNDVKLRPAGDGLWFMILMLNGMGGSAWVDKTLFVVHLLIGITLLKCVAGSMGPVKPCLCHPIRWDRLLPFCLGELGIRGVRPSCPAWTIGTACGGKNLGNGGIESGVGWGKWRWAYVKAMSRYAYVGHFGIFPGIKIDSNRWAHQVWACLISL